MLAVLNRESPSAPSTHTADRKARCPKSPQRQTKPSLEAPSHPKKPRDESLPNPVQSNLVPRGNPQLVEAHFEQIFRNLSLGQSPAGEIKEYMSRQADINAKMRGILVDWLVDVNLKFKLLPQTLFLTVNLLDRYLAAKQVSRQKLQLVGVTALMVVSKYEEVYPPMLKDFVAVCDNAYTKKEVLQMEADVLATLDFAVNRPTSYTFLELLRNRIRLEDKPFIFARYMLENALLDLSHLRHSALELATAAFFLVHKVFKLSWNPEVIANLGMFDEARVKNCAKDLYVLMNKYDASPLCAIKNKFSEQQYFEVSKYKIEKGSGNSG